MFNKVMNDSHQIIPHRNELCVSFVRLATQHASAIVASVWPSARRITQKPHNWFPSFFIKGAHNKHLIRFRGPKIEAEGHSEAIQHVFGHIFKKSIEMEKSGWCQFVAGSRSYRY